MIKKIIGLVLLVVSLSACGQTNTEAENSSEDEVPEIITAELTAPEEAATNEVVTFQVKVSQGDEPVTDPEEIQFEFWQTDDKDNSEKIDAVPGENGVYTIEKNFSESGEYHVQSHVIAESMHVMPEKIFTVTDGDMAAAEHAKHGEEHEHAAEEGHHHDVELAAELTPVDAVAGEETTLSVSVEQEGEALEGASVTLEITENTGADPVWLNLTEAKTGIYEGTMAFNPAGSIPVNIHIKKDDLHDHIEKSIEVTTE